MYLGEIYHYLCEYQQELDIYNRALKVWLMTRAQIRDEGLGWTYNNIGSAYKSQGEYQKALDFYFRSLQAYTHWRGEDGSVNTRGMGIALTNIGSIYVSLGEPQKALIYLTQAIPNWQSVKDTSGEARGLYSIGEAYTLVSDHQKALASYYQALQFWRNAADLARQTRVLNSIGKTYLLLGTYSKAPDYFNEALRLTQITGDRRGQAYALTNIGRAYHLLDQKQKALEYYTRALPLRKAVRDRVGEADTLYNLARLERDQGKLEEAHNMINKAVALVESVRTSVVSKQLRASYFATVRSYYSFSIDLLMQMDSLNPVAGYAATAFEVSERSRARSLMEMLVEANAGIRQNADPKLVARMRYLQHRLQSRAAYQMQLLSSVHSQDHANALEKEIEILTTQYLEVEAQIRTSSPHFAALTQPQPLGLEEIQKQVLDENTMLLEYALGEEYSYLWVVTSTSLQSYRLPKRAEIEIIARQMYETLASYKQRTNIKLTDETITRMLRDDTKYEQAASTLSQILLGPIAGQLTKKRLLLVTEGALQYVPFAALPVPHMEGENQRKESDTKDKRESIRPFTSVPLIAHHEIVSLPSASTLPIIRREKDSRAHTGKTVAVLADPVFDAKDKRMKPTRFKKALNVEAVPTSKAPERITTEVERSARNIGLMQNGRIPRLPSTRLEAKAIVGLVPKKESLLALDFAASHNTATTQLGQYRIVHFATHSILNNEHPELSGIVLSLVDKRGRIQDGFLRVHQVYNLRLSAELVVLSACQTALGKDIKGEGLIGLTRGFMYAGAARVVSSLWEVDSRATAELMTRFYSRMLKDKLQPAAALREAQVSMLNETQWKSPYYWAAFTMQGDWR